MALIELPLGPTTETHAPHHAAPFQLSTDKAVPYIPGGRL